MFVVPFYAFIITNQLFIKRRTVSFKATLLAYRIHLLFPSEKWEHNNKTNNY